MRKKRNSRAVPFILFLPFVLVGITDCRTTRSDTPARSPDAAPAAMADAEPRSSHASTESSTDTLELTFAGDIMAHTVNYSMSHYDRIYDDVRPLLIADDLTFGNFESPVDDDLPMSTYPLFNVHSTYLSAAISGGFDVFSLANNHSNDQGEAGILGTLASAATIGDSAQSFSGLRTAAGDAMSPVIIRKKGWTVLYLAVTEILNSYDSAGRLVYYVAPNEKGRAPFLQDLARMRKENPCDVFVLSLHSNEPEYVRKESDDKKKWFADIAAAGVDIVWGHHPHVMQGWEDAVVRDADGREHPVFFMYSMGNFISGQRFEPNLEDPGALREYTGDAVLLRVRLERTRSGTSCSGFSGMMVRPVPVTNWNDPRGGVVVRRFTADFVQKLPDVWQKYYSARYDLMRAGLPLLPAVLGTGILEE